MHCSYCGKVTGGAACSVCGATICSAHMALCPDCGGVWCRRHAPKSHRCG